MSMFARPQCASYTPHGEEKRGSCESGFAANDDAWMMAVSNAQPTGNVSPVPERAQEQRTLSPSFSESCTQGAIVFSGAAR